MTDDVVVPATPPASGDAVTAQTPVVPTVEKTDAAPDPAKTEPVKKKTDYRQQKIAELSYQNREDRRLIDRLTGLLEKGAAVPTAENQPPKVEDFKTLDEYLDARDKYVESKRPGKEAKPDDGKNAEYGRQLEAARQDLFSAGSEKHEDFVDLVTSDNVKITPVMRDAIFELDDLDIQVDATYYLAQNPKEALRISKLSPMRQVQEIGKLEVKITSAPPPKQPSKAPAPIAPVGSNAVSDSMPKDSDDTETWIKKERKRLAKKYAE